MKRYPVPLREERFELSDGDYIDGVWTDKSSGPIVILLHGLQGSANSHYINSLMHTIHHETNWQALALNLRGCGQDKQRSFRQYHSGDTEDIRFILHLIKQRFPTQPIAMVGYSLGGNLLLKLLGELKQNRLCQTAVAISPPFDLASTAQNIQKGLGKVYQKIFLDDIKSSLIKKYPHHYNTEKLQKKLHDLQTLEDLDHQFTAPMHGYDSIYEYYQDCSSIGYLNSIKVPTLVMIAKDDPIVNYNYLPKPESISNNVTLEIHEKGGHVGFISGGILNHHLWMNQRIMSHLAHYLPLCIHEETE